MIGKMEMVDTSGRLKKLELVSTAIVYATTCVVLAHKKPGLKTWTLFLRQIYMKGCFVTRFNIGSPIVNSPDM